MSDNPKIKTRADAMKAEWQSAIELMHLPGGPGEFQRRLIDAEAADLGGIDYMARLISLANAALVVGGSGIDGVAAPWYQNMAARLLRRSMEALASIEAHSEGHTDSRLN